MNRAAPALLIVLAIACGAAPPPSTSPTLSHGVVGGRVTIGAERGAASSRTTVHVVGTTVSATAGSTGEFVLPNVPAGPLELLFSAAGTSAGLAAGEIAGGETVTLAVTIADGRATVDSIARVRGADATLEGVVDAAHGALPPNTIIVAGRTVTLPAGAGAAIVPGVRVRVTGTVSGATILARDIAIL